jgi:hypothetical protein
MGQNTTHRLLIIRTTAVEVLLMQKDLGQEKQGLSIDWQKSMLLSCKYGILEYDFQQ